MYVALMVSSVYFLWFLWSDGIRIKNYHRFGIIGLFPIRLMLAAVILVI